MQRLKFGGKRTVKEKNDYVMPRLKLCPNQFRVWKKQLGKKVSGRLERIDAGLSNRQRKWLFCLGLLCWSGFLFYLLVTAVRTPPANFTLPFAAERSQTGINSAG